MRGGTMKISALMFRLLVAVSPLALASVANAQDNLPPGPIRLTVGFPAGGTVDVVGRILAQTMTDKMNVSTIVDNKPGANSNIAAELIAKSRPDGATLLLNSNSQVLSLAIGEKLTYDLFRDLAPVALLGSGVQALVVHPSVPANNVAEFIAHVKANPDKLAYYSAGNGSNPHLLTVLFLRANDLTALHVPYKGSGPALLDLVGGRIQFALQSITTIIPMVKDKRLKALAITSMQRSPLLPDVPTLNEIVMPGFEAGNWNGIMAPAKTPPAVIRQLNASIVKALQDADLRARFAQNGVEPMGSTPEEYGAYLKSELDRWSGVIKAANIKPD
jgi:tripartite-type tricarboxylate transporter receptor subunit TctC